MARNTVQGVEKYKNFLKFKARGKSSLGPYDIIIFKPDPTRP